MKRSEVGRQAEADRAAPQGPRRYVNAYWQGSQLFTFQRQAGKLLRRVERAEHSCFLPAAQLDAELASSLRGSSFVRGLKTEGAFARVSWSDRESALKGARYLQEERKLDVREGDVDPVQRFLQETGALIERPRRAYLDIETDSRLPFSRMLEMRILCWAISDDAGEVVATGVLPYDDDDSERRLLEELWRALAPFDQIVAWNGDRFDFPVIFARSKKQEIRVENRRWLWLDHLPLFKRMNATASESGDEKQSMALDSVCRTVLGEDEGKLPFDSSQTWQAWEAGGRYRDELVEYCAHDTTRMPALEKKTGYLELHHTLCDACGIFPDSRAVSPRMQVEGFLLRLGHRAGQRAPTIDPRVFGDEAAEAREQFEGAFVMEPERGVMRDVHVCDFSRMYPSIILSWNMSPETLRAGVRLREREIDRPSYLSHLPLREFPLPDGCCVTPRERVFANEPRGLLAMAVEEILALRKHWDDVKTASIPGTDGWKEADRRSTAYKIAANSFFGVVGSAFSRYFVAEVAESITTTGVWLIKQTIEAAEREGMRVIYSDTDSAFVKGCTRAAFEQFVARCNAELYPRLLAEKRCARNTIKLAYEKAFRVVVIVGKKRYAGAYSHYKGTAATADSKPEIKGLEYKRGDSARLARRMQREVVEIILRDRGDDVGLDELHFDELVASWKTRVLDGALDRADVVLSKGLGRELKEYKRKPKKDGTPSALPPHVEVALVLKERGRDVGEGARVEYVVADASTSPMRCVPAEDFDADPSQLDRFYLWENLTYPPTQRVLEAAFPEHDWGALLKARPPKPRAARGTRVPPKVDASIAASPPRRGQRAQRAYEGVQAQLGMFAAKKDGD